MKKNGENKRGKLREGIAECLLELVLTVIFFAVGWGILSLFGINADEMDSDLTVLIGIAVFAVAIAAVVAIAHFVKKKKKRNDGEDSIKH